MLASKALRMAVQQIAVLRGGLARAPASRGLASSAIRPNAPNKAPLLLSPAAPPRRCFAAAAVPEENLRTVLKEEFDYEKKEWVVNEGLKKVPAGFSVEKDEAGDGQIVLVKKAGSAEVAITFEVNDQPDSEMPPEGLEDEEDDEEGGFPVINHFVVSVTKGEKMMSFECSTNGTTLNIEHMTLEPKDGIDADSTAYTGPVFPELDEKVQERAFEYLESLGIGECCEYVASKIEDKEQQLYMEWLEGSVKFLE